MSGIGNIGSAGTQSLYSQILQRSNLLVQSALTAKSDALIGTAGSDGNPKGVSSLIDQIRSAISQALGSLDKSSSSQTVMDAIKNAIDTTLKANGIDTSAEGTKIHHHHGAGKRGSEFQQMIDQLLQENGFDPNKIRADLQAQSGSSSSTGGGPIALVLISGIPASGGVNTQA